MDLTRIFGGYFHHTHWFAFYVYLNSKLYADVNVEIGFDPGFKGEEACYNRVFLWECECFCQSKYANLVVFSPRKHWIYLHNKLPIVIYAGLGNILKSISETETRLL